MAIWAFPLHAMLQPKATLGLLPQTQNRGLGTPVLPFAGAGTPPSSPVSGLLSVLSGSVSAGPLPSPTTPTF